MKATVKVALAMGILVIVGTQIAHAAKEYVASNRVFRVVDKNTKIKETITVVANPQNAVDEPVVLCAIWEDTMAKANKGDITFAATLEFEDVVLTGTENPDRTDGLAWACFFADDDPIAVNDLAFVDVTPRKLPKQKSQNVVLVQLDLGARELVEISVAAQLRMSTKEFRSLFDERAVRLERAPKLQRE